jgi:hypothetical protein
VEPTVTEDSAWIRFEDADLGVAFEYPAGYINVGCAPRTSSSPQGGTELRLGHRINLHVEHTFIEDPRQASEAFLADQNSGPAEGTFELVQESATILGGQPAVRLAYRSGGTARFGEATFVVHNQRLYRLDFSAGDFCDLPDMGISEGQALERMLTSLQFLE